MSTDKEKFIALMREFGVPLNESGREATETLTIEADAQYDGNTKVTGYTGFSAGFTFDATTGAFIHVGIWE